MKKLIFYIALSLTALFGSINASATVLTWTLSDVKFDHDGFQTLHLFGSFNYDQSTNTFSNSTLSLSNDSNCCWSAEIITATSTSSVLNIYSNIGVSGIINFASPLTGTGGTIALASGSFSSWALRAGQSISAPVTSAVPEPASWALMIGGFGLVGAAMRSRGKSIRVKFA